MYLVNSDRKQWYTQQMNLYRVYILNSLAMHIHLIYFIFSSHILITIYMSYIGNFKNSALGKFIKILEYQQNQTTPPPGQIKNRNTNKFNCL